MYVPSVDSLSLGGLDEPKQWQVVWENISVAHLQEWELLTGLPRTTILKIHQHHRSDMVKLRQIFRHYTRINEETHQPLVKPIVNHFDPDASLLSLFRPNYESLEESILVIFNFGAKTFSDSIIYEIPIPEEFQGSWQILFDGESQESAPTYPAGHQLSLSEGQYSNQANVIRIKIAARSLIVLKYLK